MRFETVALMVLLGLDIPSAYPATRDKSATIVGYTFDESSRSFIRFPLSNPNKMSRISHLNFLFGHAGATASPTDPYVYFLDIWGKLIKVSKSTGTIEHEFPTKFVPPNEERWDGLERNLVTGEWFAISSKGACDSASLNKIDMNFGTVTNIGSTYPLRCPAALAIDANGNAWSFGRSDPNLYSVNLTTGKATAVGTVGFNPNFIQGMAYEPITNRIYMWAYNYGSHDYEFRLVNTTTGSTESLHLIRPYIDGEYINYFSVGSVAFGLDPSAPLSCDISHYDKGCCHYLCEKKVSAKYPSCSANWNRSCVEAACGAGGLCGGDACAGKCATAAPTTSQTPSSAPSPSPSASQSPSQKPSVSQLPSLAPSHQPSVTPSKRPSISQSPSVAPSQQPSRSQSPSDAPSKQPSSSQSPSVAPSKQPSDSQSPSMLPSNQPSSVPSTEPSVQPSHSNRPSSLPSVAPSKSSAPSSAPSIYVPPYQNITFDKANNVLGLTDSNVTVSLSHLANDNYNEIQDLLFDNITNILTATRSPSVVDLSHLNKPPQSLKINTDTMKLQLTESPVDIDLKFLLQDLSMSGNTISISTSDSGADLSSLRVVSLQASIDNIDGDKTSEVERRRNLVKGSTGIRMTKSNSKSGKHDEVPIVSYGGKTNSGLALFGPGRLLGMSIAANSELEIGTLLIRIADCTDSNNIIPLGLREDHSLFLSAGRGSSLSKKFSNPIPVKADVILCFVSERLSAIESKGDDNAASLVVMLEQW